MNTANALPIAALPDRVDAGTRRFGRNAAKVFDQVDCEFDGNGILASWQAYVQR